MSGPDLTHETAQTFFSGAGVPEGYAADGDMWIDTDDGTVRIWSEKTRVWTAVVDPTGRGGFYGDGRTGLEDETDEERWRRLADREDVDEVRLGEHHAVRQTTGEGELWVCRVCGGESGDAGILAETDCGR